MQAGTHLDQSEKLIKYSDFVNKELILFSMADLQRSIPSMVDGLKPGQRKILFCSFKRNFIKEAKVSQFSGYVSEHSAYHHGEQSLASTIIGMAQDFVGSNNINLLLPNGQFGTRNHVDIPSFNSHEHKSYEILGIDLFCAFFSREVKIMQVLGTFTLNFQMLHDSFSRKTTTNFLTT